MPRCAEPVFRPPGEARSQLFRITVLNLAGSSPKERERLIGKVAEVLAEAANVVPICA